MENILIHGQISGQMNRNHIRLYHRTRMCIWKQWKKTRTKVKNLLKMGVPEGYWFTTQTVAVNMAMTNERLIRSGFYDLAKAYQSVHENC